MKFQTPKVFQKLDLREYAPEMETEITVLVNPPRQLLADLYGTRLQISQIVQKVKRVNTKAEGAKEELEALGNEINLLGEKLVAWMRDNWSQGPDPETHWSQEEIQRLVEYSRDQDPALWIWLVDRTEQMIEAYRAGQKKA